MCRQPCRYALPALKWLGVRSSQLADTEEAHLQALTQRDRALLPRLRESLEGREPGWVSELDAMEAAGFKADIEALYHSRSGTGAGDGDGEDATRGGGGSGGYAGLAALVVQSILTRDFV